MKRPAMNRSKRGFSLAETAIALTVIVIVFGMAISTVLGITKTYRKADATRFFANEVENYLECYKLDGSNGFIENLTTYLDISPNVSEIDANGFGHYDFYYDNDFLKLDALPEDTSSYYVLEVEIVAYDSVAKAFLATAKDSNGQSVFTMTKSYASKYDIQN